MKFGKHHRRRLARHRDFFAENPRLSVLVNQFERMGSRPIRESSSQPGDFLPGLR